MQRFALLLFLPAFYYLWFFLAHDAAGSALLAVIIIVSAMIPFFLAQHERPHPLWFKAHTYGYGWSPARWEGWVLLGMMFILAIFVGLIVSTHSHSISDMLITAFPFWFLILTTFFAIVHRTGEKPKWWWGNKKHN